MMPEKHFCDFSLEALWWNCEDDDVAETNNADAETNNDVAETINDS